MKNKHILLNLARELYFRNENNHIVKMIGKLEMFEHSGKW